MHIIGIAESAVEPGLSVVKQTEVSAKAELIINNQNVLFYFVLFCIFYSLQSGSAVLRHQKVKE